MNKPKLIILADSHGISLGHLIEQRTSFNVCSFIKSNAKLSNVVECARERISGFGKEDYLLVIGGTNDMESQNSYNYEHILNEIKNVISISHHTNLMIASLPSIPYKPELDVEIGKINKGLEDIVALHSNVSLLPLHFLSHKYLLRNNGKIELALMFKKIVKANGAAEEKSTLNFDRKINVETNMKRDDCSSHSNESKRARPTDGLSGTSTSSLRAKQHLKRMAQERGEEEQSKKRKKWLENLAVLSSEDDEDLLHSTKIYGEQMHHSFKNGQEIYLRFPYYMGSDNSDDEDEIKYFPDASLGKNKEKEIVYSSDEVHYCKHTKRKRMVDLSSEEENSCNKQNPTRSSIKKSQKAQNTNFKDKNLSSSTKNKENKKNNLQTKNSNYSENSPKGKPSEKISSYLSRSSKTTRDPLSPIMVEEETKQRKIIASGSLITDNYPDKKEDDNLEQEHSETFQNQNNSRFLDSSSENSDEEIFATRTKETKFRRIHVLSTSSSSSDEENSTRYALPLNLRLKDLEKEETERAKSQKIQPKYCKKKQKLKPDHSLSSSTNSSDDETLTAELPHDSKLDAEFSRNNQQNVSSEPDKSSVRDSRVPEHREKLGSNFQTKPLANANAWTNISIADIKAQCYKQTKIDELKRKLVSPNASSVAIYKQIQKREILKKQSEARGTNLKPQQGKQHLSLYSDGKTASEMKVIDRPSTSALKEHNANSESKLSEMKEISDESCDHSQARRDSLLEEHEGNVELPNLPTPTTFLFGKKLRQAHNGVPKNVDNSNKFNQNNIDKYINKLNMKSKKVILTKDNKCREQQQSISPSVPNDVLGNIMSQMDNNPFKIQKPLNKKNEPTPDSLGWFPPGVNPSAFCGQPQNTVGTMQPRIDVCPSQQNFPLRNTTNVNNPNCNALHPSYNPCSAMMNRSNNNQTGFGIEKNSNLKKTDQDGTNVIKHKQNIKDSACNISSVVSREEKLAPFYLAPQEDYGKNLRTKDGIPYSTKSISSEPKQDHHSYSGNSTQQSFNNNKSSNLSSEGQRKNPITHEMRLPFDSQKNTFSKNRSNIGNDTCQSSNLTEDHYKIGSVQPRTPSAQGPPRGIGEIRRKSQNNYSNQNNTRKGIKVRFGGTEFRISPKEQINDNIVSESLPEVNPCNQTGANLELSPSASHNVHTPLTNDIKISTNNGEESQTTPAPISSTSSSSSTNNSSSSSDDSSSESSDESKKSSSSEESSSDCPDSEGKTSSQKYSLVIDKLNLLSKKERVCTQISSQKESESSKNYKNDQCKSPVKETLCTNLENELFLETPSNLVSPELIVLSSSSDSDSNEHLNNEEPMQRVLENVDNNNEHSHSSVDPPKGAKSSDTVGKELLTSSNVGKIRVKSLKELGAPCSSVGIENALKPTIASSAQNKESETIQSETASSSNINQEVVQQENNEATLRTLSRSEEPNPNQLVKKSYNKKMSTIDEIISEVISKKKITKKRTSKNTNPSTINHPLVQSEKSISIRNSQNPNSNQHVKNPSNTIMPQIVQVISLAQNKKLEKNKKSMQLGKDNSLKTPSKKPENSKLNNNQHQKNSSDVNKSKPIMFVPVIAITKPVNAVMPTVSSLNLEQNKGRIMNNERRTLSDIDEAFVAARNISSQMSVSTDASTSTGSESLSQNPESIVTMPFPSDDTKRLFFSLCDKLFTDVVNFKIPKLADDLYLLITNDIMKEERLKKIEQLLSSETIVCEKQRAEKEYADMIKVRSHSFVPLFMTIMNKINNDNLKALLTAVYCRIVQQLERIDPVNKIYRFKLKDMIKSMLIKKRSDVKQEILTYFDAENELNFLTNFGFIENLLNLYDQYVEERNNFAQQSKEAVGFESRSTPGHSNPTPRDNEVSGSNEDNEVTDPAESESVPAQSESVGESEMNRTQTSNTRPGPEPLPPTIGNLDNLFFKDFGREQ